LVWEFCELESGRECLADVDWIFNDATWSDRSLMKSVIMGSILEIAGLWRSTSILSAVWARSVREESPETVRITRIMGGRTAKKERRKISILEGLLGCKRSRSTRVLDKNWEGDSNPRDLV